VNATLEHLRVNGVHLGARWHILEEGSGTYEALVFRDKKKTPTTDSRYAMYKEKYVDL
jgi:hypothetical protein